MFKRILAFLFPFILMLFLIRLALPQHIKYLLFPSVVLFFAIAIFNFYRSKPWKNFSFGTYKILIPPAIALLAYLFAIAFTSYRSDILFRDSINLLVLCVFVFSVVISDFTYQELTNSIKRFKTQVVIFSTLFALAGVVKLYLLLKGYKLGFLEVEGLGYPQGTSLSVDDNFFTLVCVVGIIFTSFYLFTVQKLWQSILLQLSLVVLLVNIMLATSRRGLIIAASFIISYLLVWLVSWFTSSESFKRFRKNSVVFLTGIVLTIFLFGYFIFGVSTLKRNHWLANSSFNKYETVVYLNWLTMAGESIFRGEVSYDDVQKQNWSTAFDPRYPYTGWASGNYQLVDNLGDLGLKSVPDDAKGARVGNWVESSTWSGNAYYYSKLFEGSVLKGKSYLATLYCYVSPDFDGSEVLLRTGGNIKGIRNWYYDLGRKGTWQKLQTTIVADSGDYKVYLYIGKENDSTLKNLNGYAIYAYPELKEITFNPAYPLTWAKNQFEPIQQLPGGNSSKMLSDSITALKPIEKSIWYRERDSLWLFSAGLYNYNSKVGIRLSPSIYVYVSPDFNGDEVYLNAGGKIYGFYKNSYELNRKGTWQKLYLSFTIFEGNAWVDYGFRKKVKSPTDSIKGYVLFAYPEEKILKFDANNPLTWAGSNFSSVYPLTGENVEIVPKGSVGLRVDKNTQPNKTKDKVYNTNIIGKVKIESPSLRIKTSIYCYVSNNFNGKNVRISGSTKGLSGYSACYYDFNSKGTWQKLTINNWGEPGEVYYSTTYFEFPNAKDFRNLMGYVIFAHPEFNIINFDPKNPESYTSSTFTSEYPLQGKNSAIVPNGVKGARYDRNTEGIRWNNLCHSTTLFNSVNVEPGDSVFASIYCYVDSAFNGDDVRLELRGSLNAIERYNLKVKGRWVKLTAKGLANAKGKVYGVYMFLKRNAADFSGLNGHVSFAYPQLVVKSKKTALIPSSNERSLNIASLLNINLKEAADSTFKDDFQFSMAGDRFAGPRIDRWRYAIYIFKNDYSLAQKIFGGGFDYTYRFSRKFHPDNPKRDFDYPHNPFLSVLLYSGILGLLVYLWFFVKSLYLYYIYRKEYWILGITYLITFFYSFFSSNSPFEPAFFGVMAFLPYLIHYTKKYREEVK